jgi:hypothetical protein
MNGFLPKYMPKQQFTMRGPQAEDAKLPFIKGKSIPGSINFNLDNAQNLAIYVCVSFPNIPAGQANAFVDDVMERRNLSDTGFQDSEVTAFMRRLEYLERQAVSTAARNL